MIFSNNMQLSEIETDTSEEIQIEHNLSNINDNQTCIPFHFYFDYNLHKKYIKLSKK